jgi:hypothetical protein
MRFTIKYNLKISCILTIILLHLLAPQLVRAQLGPTLRNLFQSGERQVAKGIVREEAVALARLSASKNLSKGYKANITKFWEKYHCTDVYGFGVDFAAEIEKNKKNQERTIIYLKEIFSNRNYPKLYIGICNKYKRDTLKKQEVVYILLGNKINGIGLDSSKLYNLYFNFSQTFAKEELEKLQVLYKCDNTANLEINAIAQNKNITLNDQICENNEESGTAATIIGLIIFVIVLYFLWTILKKTFLYIKKLWSRWNNRTTNPSSSD